MSRRLFARVLWLAVLLGLGAMRGLGADETNRTPDTGTGALTRLPPVVTSWFRENGLPQNAISDVLQTRDGYLWVATYNGLARFDGMAFQLFDQRRLPALSGNRITALHEDRAGRLWVGEETGNVIRVSDAGRAAEVVPKRWPLEPVQAIHETADGEILLVLASREIVRASDGRAWQPPAPATSVPHILKLATDQDGGVWVQHETDQLLRLEGDALVPWAPPDGEVLEQVAFTAPARDGGVWILANRLIRRWREGRWVEQRGSYPHDTSFVASFHEMNDGTLVLGLLDVGVLLLTTDQPARLVTTADGLASDLVTSVTSDRERNVWVGTIGGLTSLRPRRVETVAAPEAWSRKGVLSVTRGPDQALWVGTEGAGLYRLKDGETRRYAEAEGLSKLYVWSVLGNSDGSLWVGTWGEGLFHGRDGRFEPVAGWDPAAVAVTALLRASNNDLFVGTNRGLARLDSATLRWTWWREHAGEPVGHVRCLAEDAAGRIWFGTAGHGLGRLQEGEITLFGIRDGLPGLFVWSLLAKGDELWIGTSGGGLARYRAGRFDALSTDHGLPGDTICSISATPDGETFWFSSLSGVFALSARDLVACMDQRRRLATPLLLGRDDGLATIESSGGAQQAALLEADGTLWVATPKSLVRIETQTIGRLTVSPPVVILSGRVDDREVSGEWDRELTIPPGPRRVEIAFAALNFSSPDKVRFRYRLDALAEEWVDIGHSRSIFLNYIEPGTYRLHVTASNRDGYWNELGDDLTIHVLPYFWETWPFRLVAALAAAGLLSWAVRAAVLRRTRLRMADLERSHAIERERTRISRDLHDDLGVTLTRLHRLSQSALTSQTDPAATQRHLQGIGEVTHEITRSMDEIVWAASPRHDTLESFVAYFSRFAQETLRAAGIRCRLDFPLEMPERALTAEFRHNLFLACKEVLNNAVRHARATEVLVAVRCDDTGRHLGITVTDDGRGFVPDLAAAELVVPGASHGNGTRNLRQRLAALGGRIDWESAPGRGTTVRMEVPIP